ncbi:insecticidal toxin complex protein [Penicillium sp. IBT 18751x]|nr:insecticidal toxin complex protein [Penicillium sp. IBT 18751x]
MVKLSKEIRFAEVLTKVYGSKFTVGEILFLFTVEHHLDGDDPFPLASRLETFDRPLKLPDDQLCNSLDSLREKLLCVEISNDECEEVGWHKLDSIIKDAGYMPFKKANCLQDLAEHFFPETLGGVSSEKRRYSTPLSLNQTSPKVWSADPCIPFHYEISTSSSTDFGEPTPDQTVVLTTVYLYFRGQFVSSNKGQFRPLRKAKLGDKSVEIPAPCPSNSRALAFQSNSKRYLRSSSR